MNQGNEKNFGILYVNEPFDFDGEYYHIGHYFYRKNIGNPSDFRNSRYFPNGFPVEVTQVLPGAQIPRQLIDDYIIIFPNLVTNVLFVVEIDSRYNQEELDSLFPMAAFLHRCIAHSEPVDGAPNGRGLPKFTQGQSYVFRRVGDDVGLVERSGGSGGGGSDE
jgi:hypothetical protein